MRGLALGLVLGWVLVGSSALAGQAGKRLVLTPQTTADAMVLRVFEIVKPHYRDLDKLDDAQLEEAGVLFYAFKQRAEYELAGFPPAEGGPAQAYGALEYDLGEKMNPLLFLHPAVLGRVVARVEAWTPTLAGFRPEWKHGQEHTQEAEAVQRQNRKTWSGDMHRMLSLLGDPGYFAAFKRMRACETAETCRAAFRVLWDEEKRRGLRGPAMEVFEQRP